MFSAQFQSFSDPAARADSAGRVAALRAELKRRGLDDTSLSPLAGRGEPDQARSKSVCAKSLPLNSSGAPKSLAAA
jgi:hypothetical protein